MTKKHSSMTFSNQKQEVPMINDWQEVLPYEALRFKCEETHEIQRLHLFKGKAEWRPHRGHGFYSTHVYRARKIKTRGKK